MTERREAQPWWGTFEVPHGQARRWTIGPLTLWAARFAGEWRLARTSEGNGGALAVERGIAVAVDELGTATSTVRYGVEGGGESLTLTPALADRPVVSRPDRPFVVSAGASVTLFLGTPLWLRVRDGGRDLTDEPIARPSDTWFGPPTEEGELCYASRTFCRLLLDEVPLMPHRATTAVTIRNQTSDPLMLERLKLPVTSLGLYVAGDGRLWTESATFEWMQGTEMAAFRVEPGAPSRAPVAEPLAPPRMPSTSPSVVVRAFSTLFG